MMFTTLLSSSSSPASVVQHRAADKRVLVKSMKRSQHTIIPGKKCRVITHATASSSRDTDKAVSRRESAMMMMVFGSSVAWTLPSLAFGISSDAKADLAASRDAKKAAILAAARAKAEGQAANVMSSSQEQDDAEEAPTTKAAFQPASFSDASKSGAGVRGGGPSAGNTYEVTKQATPAPAATPEPSAPAPAPAGSSSDDDGDGGFGLPSVSLPSVSLPSLPKLPF